jgi:hypothetical protein
VIPKIVHNFVSGGRESSLVGVATGWLHRSSTLHGNQPSNPLARALDVKAADLWVKINDASYLHQGAAVRLPESRTVNTDWVRDGVHMRR